MATVVKRGKASVDGIVGSIDLIAYAVKQSGSATHNFDLEEVKDESGFDAAWLARNTHILSDFKLKMLGDTAAHAKSQTFIAPLATVTLSGFDLADFNGTYQNMSGAQIDLNNTSVADFATKFRKYADATQNTASQTTPT